MNYEINFLILQSQTEKVDKIKQQVKKLIESKGGKITDELSYKKRKLAYEIKHEQYGFYTVYRFDLESGEVLKELTKELNLLSEVARHIIVKSDELPALQKEIGKDTMAEQEKKSKENAASAKATGKKVLDEITKETKKQTAPTATIKNTTKTETSANTKEEKKNVKKEAPKVEKEEKTGSKEQETKEETKENKKEDKKEEEKTTTKKKEKKDEISIEDLDKKLDEILDI